MFGAKIKGTSADICSHVSFYCTVLYFVAELREECGNCWAQGTGTAFQSAGSFHLTAWNPANFIGASSKSHFFSEFFREAGACEDFPTQAWENENKSRAFGLVLNFFKAR